MILDLDPLLVTRNSLNFTEFFLNMVKIGVLHFTECLKFTEFNEYSVISTEFSNLALSLIESTVCITRVVLDRHEEVLEVLDTHTSTCAISHEHVRHLRQCVD